MEQAEQTALYRFYDHEDRLLYVGVTQYIKVRWATHRRVKSWWYEVVRREVEWFDTRELALEMETRTIIAERPTYNITHSRDRVFKRRIRPKGWNVAANPPARPFYDAVLEEVSRRGQTKTWLVRRSGVSRSGIDNLAKQPRPPQASTVHALAKALDMDVKQALRLAGLRVDATAFPIDDATDLSQVPTDVLLAELRRRIDELARRTQS